MDGTHPGKRSSSLAYGGLLLFFVFGLFFLACTPPPLAPLRLGSNIWLGSEPFFLARDLGFLDKERFRAIEFVSTSDVIRSFRNGELDAATLTLDEVLLATQDGIPARIIQVLDVSVGGDALIAKPPIQHLAQLKGKRVGAETTALGAYMLSRALEAGGISPKDITIVPLTEDRIEKAFIEGKVDAVVTFEPIKIRLLAHGGQVIFDSRTLDGEIVDVLVVKEAVLKERPEEVRALVAAWRQALAYLRDHPSEAMAHMSKRIGLSRDQFRIALDGLRLGEEEANRALLTGDPPELCKTAQRLAKIMAENQLLKSAIDPCKAILAGKDQEQLP